MMSEKKIVLSRIGKAPVEVPKGVSVVVEGEVVTVKGPRGSLQRTFKGVTFEVEPAVVRVAPTANTTQGKAMHGLGRALLRNMVVGVSDGYKRELDVKGVGFRAELAGQTLTLSIGYSHPVRFAIPAGVTGKVENQTHLVLESVDKELIGETAARIRGLRPPEPYKGKGIQYTGEVIRRKAGKSGGKGGKK
jgi:large subunit ribosomal protein L6